MSASISTVVSSPRYRSQPARPRSEGKRTRIVDAAMRHFAEQGYDAARVGDLAAMLGIAKGSIFQHFGSKDGLVRAYLQARHAATAERMERELQARYGTPKERLIGAFEIQGLSFTEPGFRGCAMQRHRSQPGRDTS